MLGHTFLSFDKTVSLLTNSVFIVNQTVSLMTNSDIIDNLVKTDKTVTLQRPGVDIQTLFCH